MLGMGDMSLLGIPWLKIEGKSHNKEYIRKLDVLLIKYTLCIYDSTHGNQTL